jgi:hypothetical protein
VIKAILSGTILSSLLISTAFASPFSPTPHQQTASNAINIGYYNKNYHKSQKNYYKAEKKYYNKHYNNKYYYGGRAYGHRYYARPPGWQTLGCFAAGPVWYCP